MTTLYELSNEYQAAFNNMQDMDLDAETIKDSLSAIKRDGSGGYQFRVDLNSSNIAAKFASLSGFYFTEL